jgi:hypothetical protein
MSAWLRARAGFIGSGIRPEQWGMDITKGSFTAHLLSGCWIMDTGCLFLAAGFRSGFLAF